MFALTLVAAIAAGPCQVITNEPRIKFLEGEIARTKAHLAKLEKQLAQLKPPPKVKTKPKPTPRQPEPEVLQLARLTVGDTGLLRDPDLVSKVARILDDGELILGFTRPIGLPEIIVRTPTKGLAEGRIFEPRGVWKVTGTRKHLSRTYYVVEPE